MTHGANGARTIRTFTLNPSLFLGNATDSERMTHVNLVVNCTQNLFAALVILRQHMRPDVRPTHA